MRVLDLDLDYFLTGLCYPAEKGERPTEGLRGGKVEAMPEEWVKDFLTLQCGLTRPVPGRVFETHDEALTFWQEEIARGRLSEPFEVVHVDAHADLGIGRPGPNYVLYNVLSRDVAARRRTEDHYAAGQLDEANYLLFALAMRCVSRLSIVQRPFSEEDIPRVIEGDGVLKLPEPFPELFGYRYGREPVVPFRRIREDGAFRADGAFDYVTLALSPRYVPQGAEGVRKIIEEVIA